MSDTLIIIPTYNEIENIEKMIDTLMGFDYGYHLLVVDDGSPDGTADAVKNKQSEHSGRIHIIERSGKLGLGTAYITGFKWALENSYEFILEMDADFSHNPKDVIRLREACEAGSADVTIGSRYVEGGRVSNWPMNRVLLSRYASVYVKMITFMPVNDTTAGFVCWHREVLETIDLDKIRFIGYAFQIEMKFAAWRLGFKLKEVPITFTDRVEGVSKMSKGIFKEAVLGVIKMKLKSFTNSYRRSA